MAEEGWNLGAKLDGGAVRMYGFYGKRRFEIDLSPSEAEYHAEMLLKLAKKARKFAGRDDQDSSKEREA